MAVACALVCMSASAARSGAELGPRLGPVWYPPVLPAAGDRCAPAPPPVYIEQSGSRLRNGAGQQYWYYCKSGKGYYPYVKECPEGWQKVLPQPEQMR